MDTGNSAGGYCDYIHPVALVGKEIDMAAFLRKKVARGIDKVGLADHGNFHLETHSLGSSAWKHVGRIYHKGMLAIEPRCPLLSKI